MKITAIVVSDSRRSEEFELNGAQIFLGVMGRHTARLRLEWKRAKSADVNRIGMIEGLAAPPVAD